MNKMDVFIASTQLQETEHKKPLTVVDNQINEITKQLDDSLENYVNSYIVDQLPPDDFIENFIKAVNSDLLGKIPKQNAKILLGMAINKYMIKSIGVNPESNLFKVLTNNQTVIGLTRAIVNLS